MSNEAKQSDGTIRAALNRARRDLLDLTFRNNFLNYRILKARGLAVTEDDAVRVASLLIDGGAPLTFIARDEAEAKRDSWLAKRERGRAAQDEARTRLGEKGAEEEMIAGTAIATEGDGEPTRSLVRAEVVTLRSGLHDRILVADHDGPDLDRRLLSTLKIARTLIEERGVNTLFLSLGTLQWTESDQSDVVRTSPLILIPVVLERSSVSHGVRMKHDGEDLQGNPTLQERLRQDGIDLPLPNDDTPLADYLEAVEAAVRSKQRWRVDRTQVSLGFFSFTRYLMYLDLDVDRWPDPARVLEHHHLDLEHGHLSIRHRSTPHPEVRSRWQK